MCNKCCFSAIVITGATGYIGEAVTQMALARGLTVVAATRKQPTRQLPWLPFDLGTPAATRLPDNTRAIIHLATATNTRFLDAAQELAATKHLLAEAQRVGARFVFVSSQTASSAAISRYGQNKWALEQAVLAAGGCVLRPGLVYGGAPRGLYGRLLGVVRRLPLLPAFVPAPPVQPVHVDDVAQILLNLAAQPSPSPVLCVGAATPVSFTHFLTELAHARQGLRRLCVPVPTLLIRLAAACLPAGLAQRLGLEQLLSLFTLPAMSVEPQVAQQLRPLAAGLAKPGRERRQLIAECRALLVYLLRQPPPLSLLRRTVRSLIRIYGPQPLGLSRYLCATPAGLALFDTAFTRPRFPALAARISATALLAEASPAGARRFMALEPRESLFMGALRIIGVGLGGVVTLLLAIVLGPREGLWSRRGGPSS